jgi:hypothetical protein
MGFVAFIRLPTARQAGMHMRPAVLSISTATFSRVRTTLENKGMIAKVKKEGKRFEAYHRIVKESSARNE